VIIKHQPSTQSTLRSVYHYYYDNPRFNNNCFPPALPCCLLNQDWDVHRRVNLERGSPVCIELDHRMARPRWLLHIQAQIWRSLMAIGMFIHRLAPPRPPPPSFSRVLPTAISPRKGWVRIQFYVPKDYDHQKSLRKKKFPVVNNFHSGGFTLGTATDDDRWAQTVVEECGAVVASVDYRLAPEHPFPPPSKTGSTLSCTSHSIPKNC